MSPADLSTSLALDANGLDRLRAQAKHEPDAALKAAARQFEALFMNMLLKSMRDASPQDGMMQSDQTRLYTSMLDQQFAQLLAGRGLGLSDVMVKQLSRAIAAEAQGGAAASGTQTVQPGVGGPAPGAATLAAPSPLTPTRVVPPAAPVPPAPGDSTGAVNKATNAAPASSAGGSARDFVNRVWPHAVEASRATGIPPHFMVGQAALESGWGRSEIRGADGAPSHNLFGIKAGRGWTGASTETMTTEFVNGVAEKRVERFRSYSSYAEAFKDYANLLKNNPRYAGVLERAQDAEGFARGLQQAGYATDPMYADKLLRILNGNLLRQSLAG